KYAGGAGNDNQGYWRGIDSDIAGWAIAPDTTLNYVGVPTRDDAFDRHNGLGSNFGSAHSSGMFGALGDGSGPTFQYNVTYATFQAACGRNDNLAFSMNDL